MKKIVAMVMAMLLVVSVTVVFAGGVATTKEDQPEKVDQQIFENKEIKVPSEEEFVADEVLVKFKPGVGKEKIDEIISKHGGVVRQTSPYTGTKRITVPKGKSVPEMVGIYSKNPSVVYAEPNYIDRALMVPNDPGYSLQWHLNNTDYGGINMESAWDISTGSGVIVAVLDTGVAYEDYQEFVDGPGRRDYWITYAQAPDLADTTFVPGHDFVNDDIHPNDDNSHGTHVAGTIAQTTNNGEGVAGVAFNCSIIPIKTLNADGSGTHTDFADGVYFAVDNGADVISYSGGGSDSITKMEAVEYAYDNGVTFVAAAGNDGPNGPSSYPAAYDAYCIAVGATRYDETVSYYSTTGDYVDIAAPGGDVTVDQNGDGYGDGVLQNTFNPNIKNPQDFGYWFFQGTSMATPHVSGVAALLIANGVTGPDNVREALESTAEDKGAPGWDQEYGWGIVDAYAALQWTETPNNQPVADAGGLYYGTEDMAITFNGSVSSDPDGDPLTYAWDFGDGTQATVTTPIMTHTYTTGNASETMEYVVTLTVNDGKVDSAPSTTTATVTGVNDAPVADAGGPYSGIVSEAINFDGSGSSDEEGAIASYIWDFGDGTDTVTTTTPTTTHIYSAEGAYTVTLTVTDVDGEPSEDTTTAEVTEAPTNVMHVANIEMWYNTAGRNYFIYTMVTIVDSEGDPVAEATVYLETTLPDGSEVSDSGSTNGDGTVTFKLKSRLTGDYTSEVTNVVNTDLEYDPTANEETSNSIAVS